LRRRKWGKKGRTPDAEKGKIAKIQRKKILRPQWAGGGERAPGWLSVKATGRATEKIILEGRGTVCVSTLSGKDPQLITLT